jgi:hypothetical protein
MEEEKASNNVQIKLRASNNTEFDLAHFGIQENCALKTSPKTHMDPFLMFYICI